MTGNVNAKKNVAVIGGGTGSFVVLSGLRDKNVNLTSLVTMMDSGGSTGRLRDQLGVLPPGDLRQSLVALSKTSKIWRDLFLYRFENGDFGGHNFGNIFLSALEKITGNIEEGIELAAEVLRVKGKVIPITLDDVTLCVHLEDGNIIEGENLIDTEEINRARIVHCFLNPSAKANPKALEAIYLADFIIMGPGDLYTSLIPNLLVQEVAEAILNSQAKLIYISNLMTKIGQTDNFTVSHHVKELNKYTKNRMIEYVLVNNAQPSGDLLKWYERFNSHLVSDDMDQNTISGTKVIRGNFISDKPFEQNKADKLSRSLVRHDSNKLAKSLCEVFGC